MSIQQVIIRFPEIRLQTRDAHKLRGYFGNLFASESPLLHNHLSDGSLSYSYPKVQYKVINNQPLLVGLGEGAELLTALFMKIRELNIDGRLYPIDQKNISTSLIQPGSSTQFHKYEFQTLWMGLNQTNASVYTKMPAPEKKAFLERVLTGNCLSFLKGMEIFIDERLQVRGAFTEKLTTFKNKRMFAFSGFFEVNASLPDYIGLGKQVSRGFGTIIRTA